MNLRLAAGVVTALMAIGGGVGALAAYTDYLPATRGYAKYAAKSETDSALTAASAPHCQSATGIGRDTTADQPGAARYAAQR